MQISQLSNAWLVELHSVKDYTSCENSSSKFTKTQRKKSHQNLEPDIPVSNIVFARICLILEWKQNRHQIEVI